MASHSTQFSDSPGQQLNARLSAYIKSVQFHNEKCPTAQFVTNRMLKRLYKSR